MTSTTRTRTLKTLLAPSLLTLAMFAGATQAAAPLRPPQGYFAPIERSRPAKRPKAATPHRRPTPAPCNFAASTRAPTRPVRP